jgi:hypothetical protein
MPDDTTVDEGGLRRVTIDIPGVGQYLTDARVALYISRLKERAEYGDRTISQLRTAVEYRENDLKIIAEALRDEAVNRDWCDEFAQFVDAVNDRTQGEWLQKANVEYLVRFRVTVKPEHVDDIEGVVDTWLRDNDYERCENFDTEEGG